MSSDGLDPLTEQLALIPALLTAVQLGVVERLLEGPVDAAALGAQFGLDIRALDLVLNVLVAYELVARDETGSLLASPRLKALNTSFPGGLATVGRLAGHLPELIRTGAPYFRDIDDAKRRGEFYKAAVGQLAGLWHNEARALARSIEFSPRRVLDVGCGSGVWGLSILRHFEGATLTGLDLPDVVPAFEQAARAAQLSHRVNVLPDDVFEVTLNQRYDLVLVANVLRLEQPARAKELVRKLASALTPRGELVVVDALASGSPKAEQARALYALNLATRSRQGQVHDRQTLTTWLNEAGLPRVRTIELPLGAGALGALIAGH